MIDESCVTNFSYVFLRCLKTKNNGTCLLNDWIRKGRLPHDDVIKWKHVPLYWSLVSGEPVKSLYKGQWHGALIFSLICSRTNDWVNTPDAGDFRRHCAHYDVSLATMYPVPYFKVKSPQNISRRSGVGLLHPRAPDATWATGIGLAGRILG